MDRNRLKEVHTSDLNESRVNEDFVTWLKNSGPTYFLIVLICLLAGVSWVRWKEKKASDTKEAWAVFSNSQLPSALVDVATEYEHVGSLPQMARLTASEMLMRAVQSNMTLSAGVDAPIELTEEERTQYLERADVQYQAVLDTDDQSMEMTIIMVSAYNGRAAVAESRGELEIAKTMYEQAAARAGEDYPYLAAQSRQRIETVAIASRPITLVTSNDLSTLPDSNASVRTPLIIESNFLDAISPSNF